MSDLMDSTNDTLDTTAAASSRRTVLVADDDDAILLLIRQMLERAGYSVIAAGCGREAIALYKEHNPDLVLLDAVMPNIDGFEATEQLVTAYGKNCAPIMILTSLNDDASVERAFQAGAVDFVSKPILWSVILKRMSRLFDARDTVKALEREREQAIEDRIDYERRLQQSQKNEAIGRLASGLAHDFNNILTSIVGYVDLVERLNGEDSDPRVNQYLGEISRASERAKQMVRNMLKISSRASGDKKVVAVQELLSEVTALLKSVSPASVSVEQHNVAEPVYVEVDPVQLHQCLMNLGINARDAMRGGGHIELSVGLEQIKGQSCASCFDNFSGEYVALSVSDDGEGIAPEVLEKVFEPFFTTREVGQGTGMGLAVVHGFVHQHDGHIDVDSKPGVGSKFTLYFPKADDLG